MDKPSSLKTLPEVGRPLPELWQESRRDDAHHVSSGGFIVRKSR